MAPTARRSTVKGFVSCRGPRLFSAPVLERIRSQGRDARAAAPVPYFAGVRSGETDALVRSFAGEPELHHPIRGRVKGRRAFERFVTETNAWLVERNAASAMWNASSRHGAGSRRRC